MWKDSLIVSKTIDDIGVIGSSTGETEAKHVSGGEVRWMVETPLEEGGDDLIVRDSLIYEINTKNKFCCAKEPFMSTSALSFILNPRNVKTHPNVLGGVMYVSSGGSGEGLTENTTDGIKIPVIPKNISYIYATEMPTGTLGQYIGNSIREPFNVSDSDSPVIHKNNIKMLLYHFSQGIAGFHSENTLNLSVTLNDLLIHEGPNYTVGTARLNSNSMVAVENIIDGQLVSVSNAPRCDPYFRPPEGFVSSPKNEIFTPVEPSVNFETSLVGLDSGVKSYFKFTNKFDVWSLGICFLLALSKRGIYRIAAHKGLMSDQALKSIEAYKAKVSKDPNFVDENVEIFIKRECVAWQSMVLFGSADSSEDHTGSARRREYIERALTDAADREVHFHPSDKDLYVDLIFRMLTPNSTSRISITEVLRHPVFSGIGEKSVFNIENFEKSVGNRGVLFYNSPLFNISQSSSQFHPKDPWNHIHDSVVVQTLRRYVYDPIYSHLPAVAVFVAYDNAARAVSALTETELVNRTLAVSIASAAVRLSFLLYDSASSLYEDSSSDLSNPKAQMGIPYSAHTTVELSQLVEPIVFEYLGFDLRRGEKFIYSHLDRNSKLGISPAFSSEIYDFFNLLVNADGKSFREVYLVLDVPEFISKRYGIGGRSLTSTGLSRSSSSPEFTRMFLPENVISNIRKASSVAPLTVGDLASTVKQDG